MTPQVTTGRPERGAVPRRRVAPRVGLVIAGVVVGLGGALVAMSERGAPGRPVPEEPAPGHDATRHRAAPRTGRPALPAAVSPSAVSGDRPSTRAETKLVVTQIKAQKYVEEAYPAWRRAHPGEDCPRRLIELNEYMADKDAETDANDAWGRPMRMQCGAALPSGGKGFKVTSFGRDGERSEDDIRFGE